ncbi:MAG: hypothetical protein H7839_08200 [Magnetococcus sp. YQC-5]
MDQEKPRESQTTTLLHPAALVIQPIINIRHLINAKPCYSVILPVLSVVWCKTR